MNIKRSSLVLAAILSSPALATAFPVSVDADRYEGFWSINGIRYAGPQIVDLPAGTYEVFFGDFGSGALIAVDEAGTLSTTSSKLLVSGSTVSFVTVPVTLDPAAFQGSYGLGRAQPSFLAGLQTVYLPPGGSGPGEGPGLYALSFGYANNVVFAIDSAGAVSASSTKISISGSTITFITVPITFDPGLYVGLWALDRAQSWISGEQTLNLVPAGTGADDSGGRYIMTFSDYLNAVFFDIAPDGSISTDSTKVTVTGSTISFETRPVVVDPGSYQGLWSMARSQTWITGLQTVHLVPQGSGADDLGGRFILQFGDGTVRTWFDLDADGNVHPVTAFDPAFADKVTLADNRLVAKTVSIRIEPLDYTGAYNLGRAHPLPATGDLLVDLVPSGQYPLGRLTPPTTASFELRSPCAVDTGLDSDPELLVMTGNQFRITCVDASPPDADQDGIPDDEDICPNNDLVGDWSWQGETNGGTNGFVYTAAGGFEVCGDDVPGTTAVTRTLLASLWNGNIKSNGNITTTNALADLQIKAQNNGIAKVSGHQVGGQYRWTMANVTEGQAFVGFLRQVNGQALLDELLQP